MADWNSRDGGCRCGRLRFRVTKPPMITMACHCRGCQRMTASAFSLSAAIPFDGFAVTEGEPVRGGAQQVEGLEHFFCGYCMSWVFTRFPEVMGDFVNLRAALLDETGDIAPFVETCTAEKLSWAVTPAKHSYERFPEMEAFPGLMQEFAAAS